MTKFAELAVQFVHDFHAGSCVHRSFVPLMTQNASTTHVATARIVLGIAVLCVSCGAVFARFAESPALATAAWRMTFATAIIALPLLRSWRELRRLTKRDLLLGSIAGLCLALHFATWITSLSHTTVASSTVLVNTAPIWIALLAPLTTRELTSGRAWTGIALSFVGAAFIAGGDLRVSGPALWGDALATMGALCLAFYILVGRQLRARLSLTHYCVLTYATSVIVLWLLVGATGTQATGFNGRTWAALTGMAVVAQIGGHTLYNWSLKHLSAGVIAIALMGEPVGSSLLAWKFFGEVPPLASLAGAVLVLAGIYLASTESSTP